MRGEGFRDGWLLEVMPTSSTTSSTREAPHNTPPKHDEEKMSVVFMHEQVLTAQSCDNLCSDTTDLVDWDSKLIDTLQYRASHLRIR